MGKSSKASKSEVKGRRAVVEQMRRDQVRAEKKRTYAVIAACSAVGLIIVGLAASQLIKDERTQDRLGAGDLASIGSNAEVAGCQDPKAAPATGSADHQPEGQQIVYKEAPPASGPHYAMPAPMARKFYSDDRPKLGYLVHNLEHGYNILWYDETIAEDEEMRAEIEAIANEFPGASDPRNKFIAAPWTADDGGPFPDGAHVAMTHWSLGGTNGNDKGQKSIWQYCEAPSGEAVASFVEAYPYTDAPEPNAA